MASETMRVKHMGNGVTLYERIDKAYGAAVPQPTTQPASRPGSTKLAVAEVQKMQRAERRKAKREERKVLTKSARIEFENRTRGLTEDGMLNDHDVNRSINEQRPVASQHDTKRTMKKRYEELATRSGKGVSA